MMDREEQENLRNRALEALRDDWLLVQQPEDIIYMINRVDELETRFQQLVNLVMGLCSGDGPNTTKMNIMQSVNEFLRENPSDGMVDSKSNTRGT